MTTPEDTIEQRLRAAAALHDPVPSIVTEAAKAAFELRDLDVQLAALVADSWADSDLVATRDHLALARGEIPRARSSLTARSCLSGCGRSLTAVRWADWQCRPMTSHRSLESMTRYSVAPRI